MGILPMCSTGVSPVCTTGILPVVLLLLLLLLLLLVWGQKKKKKHHTAKTAVVHTGKMPVLRFPHELLQGVGEVLKIVP
jgi:hypothetical protein